MDKKEKENEGAFTITSTYLSEGWNFYVLQKIYRTLFNFIDIQTHNVSACETETDQYIYMHTHSCIMCLAVLSSLLNLMREGTSTVGADKPSEEFSANVVKLFLRGGKFFAPFSAQSDKFNHSNSANPTQFHHILAATTN